MKIREMSSDECLGVLAGARLARLACAHENQPYVVPVYLAYHQSTGGGACLYGFTTPGQKVEWMRNNPLVCVEVDQVAASDQWVSVVAIGRYEELPEASKSPRAPERPRNAAEDMLARPADAHMSHDEPGDDERLQAWQIIKALPMWWQPGSTVWATRAHRDSAEPFIPVYYRIWIDRVTGHEATRDGRDGVVSCDPSVPAAGTWDRLCRTLTRVFRGRSKEAGSAF